MKRILLALVLLVQLCVPVRAAALPELTVSLLNAPEVEFQLYPLTEQLRSCPVDLTDPSAAVTLAGFVRAQELAPEATAVTDSEGLARFGPLPQGQYLVLAAPLLTENLLLTPMPILVELTQTTLAQVKFTTAAPTDPVTLGAVKQWAGEADHPDTVTVALYRDGKLLETAGLSAANGWRHIWQELEPGHEYCLAELDIPRDYTLSVTLADGWYTLTNTYTPSSAPGSNPEMADPVLPQTGQYWWPVPVLAGLGLVLFAAGYLLRKGRRHEA